MARAEALELLGRAVRDTLTRATLYLQGNGKVGEGGTNESAMPITDTAWPSGRGINKGMHMVQSRNVLISLLMQLSPLHSRHEAKQRHHELPQLLTAQGQHANG